MSDTCLVQSVPPRQTGLEIDLLGSLEVSRAGQPVEFGSAKERALLAILALRLGEVVSIDSLIDALWGAQPPADPLASLHVLISRLRKALGADCIVTRGRGYSLSVDAESIDLVRFERLHASGRASLAAGDAREAASTLRRALTLWRGEPLADLRPSRSSRPSDTDWTPCAGRPSRRASMPISRSASMPRCCQSSSTRSANTHCGSGRSRS